MAAGPPLYIRCPGCGEIERIVCPDGDFQDLFTRWTDGRNFEWRLRGFSDDLYLGYSCGTLFWGNSAESIRQPLREVYGADATKPAEPPYSEPVAGQSFHLADAIEQGMCPDPAQELHVRMHLWWNFNSPFRPLLDPKHGRDQCRIVDAAVERPESFVRNARRLIELLRPDNVRELILIAELHRELGDFGVAVSVLADTANLFHAQQELEREQSRLYQAEAREQWGDSPIFSYPVRAEVLVTVARRIVDLALQEDTLVRPVEQRFADYGEVLPDSE
jgi:hypothetical protein